jgi:hypothetical protein
MLHKYSDYISNINEGSSKRPQVLYWNSQVEKLLNNEWTEINSKRYTGSIYSLNFKAGEDDYDYYNILIEKKGSSDFYYMEDSTKFAEKLKIEFWKNPDIYYKELKYAPKVLGDISHLKDADKFNL